MRGTRLDVREVKSTSLKLEPLEARLIARALKLLAKENNSKAVEDTAERLRATLARRTNEGAVIENLQTRLSGHYVSAGNRRYVDHAKLALHALEVHEAAFGKTDNFNLPVTDGNAAAMRQVINQKRYCDIAPVDDGFGGWDGVYFGHGVIKLSATDHPLRFCRAYEELLGKIVWHSEWFPMTQFQAVNLMIKERSMGAKGRSYEAFDWAI